MTDQDKGTFAKAMARLCIALREHEPDAVQLRTYFDALKGVEVEFVVMAADRLLSSAAYFPRAGEWHAMALTVRRERIEAQREYLRKLPQPLCDACGDTGWRRHVSDQANGVVRCVCQDERRAELLGHREVPLLPASTAPADPTQEQRVMELARPAIKSFPDGQRRG